MRKLLLAGSALLALAACGQKSENVFDNSTAEALDVREEATVERAAGAAADASAQAAGQTPPAIDQNVAPGVAFDFSFAFSLPEMKISQMQEEHATLCGKLGISRCRVTGITFNKERDGDIDARLAFKIDPALALSFGRDATALVEREDGKLETSTVTGEDVGTQIVAGDKSAEAIRAELRQIEAQLRIPNLSKEVRSRLVERQNELNIQLRDNKSTRDGQVESLATTPMVFTYEPSGAVMGFERGSAIQKGLSAGAFSFDAVLSVLAFALGAVGPWLLLGGAGLWLYRRLRKPIAPSPAD